LIRNQTFEFLLALAALATCLPVLGSELSVEPSPLETGSEVVVHLSSTQFTRYSNNDCWDGPLPYVSSQGVNGDALMIDVSGEDYVLCNAAPLDIHVPLGTIPVGVVSVQLYGCGGNPPPGLPYCSSTPFLTLPVAQPIFRDSFE
jgi:hypothetical protein